MYLDFVRWTAFVCGMLLAAGCGGQEVTVTGQVSCQGKPVSGAILFSPQGDAARGPAVSAPLKEDGTFELRLTTTGKHTIVITPRDVILRPKAGEVDYPCDRSPLTRDLSAGDNDLKIELDKRIR